jgi:hypothetical protein
MRMMRNNIVSLMPRSTVLILRQQTNRRHRTKTKTLIIAQGGTLKAPPGMAETIFNHNLERGVTLPHQLPKLNFNPTVARMLYRKPDYPTNSFHYEQPTSKTRKRMAQNITLEPG